MTESITKLVAIVWLSLVISGCSVLLWEEQKVSMSFDASKGKCSKAETTEDFNAEILLSKADKTQFKLCRNLTEKSFELVDHNVACHSSFSEVTNECQSVQ